MGTPNGSRPSTDGCPDTDTTSGANTDTSGDTWADDMPKTPPLRSRGRAVLRAIAIVSVFVFAGSMMMWVVCGTGEGSTEWWVEFLVVPGFFLGLVVAAADYLRQRSWR